MIEVLELPQAQYVIAVGVEVREELLGPLPLDDELGHEHADGVILHQTSRVAWYVLLKDRLYFRSATDTIVSK